MAEPHQAKGFNTANLDPRETRGNPGVGACNLLSVSVFFSQDVYFSAQASLLPTPSLYVTVVLLSFSLSLSLMSQLPTALFAQL